MARAIEKYGKTDTSPEILISAALEELGEVAHAIIMMRVLSESSRKLLKP